MNETFDGKKIKSVIKAKKLKVKDLAEAIGVTPNTLSSALNGNRALGRSARKFLFRELEIEASSTVGADEKKAS
nr:hypothetical protein BdHM001_18260 [Bdellovibrio sp. HM001]